MTTRQRMLTVIGALSLAVALTIMLPTPGTAGAASRPNAYWGTFTKPATLKTCLSFAHKALADQGYREQQDAGYMVMGFSNTVAVSVVCIPRDENAWVAVNAYSDDDTAAAAARSLVRESIQNMISFDGD